MDRTQKGGKEMSESIRNINAGDTIIYKGFSEEIKYFVTNKKTTESFNPKNREVKISGTLACKSLKEDSIDRYNNFYCVADGMIPNVQVIRRA